MSNTNNLKTFFKGSAVLVLSNICLKAINFFLLPLYTSYLTPTMLGVSDTITTFTGLLFPLFVMGLDSAYSAFYFDSRDLDRDKKIYNTIRLLMLIVSIIPIIACLFSKQISVVLFHHSDNWLVIVISLISVSINLWYLPLTLELRMKNRMTIFSVITVVSSLLMILFNVIFVTMLKLGIYALILTTAIVYFVQFILLLICIRQKFETKFIDKNLIKKIYKFALPLVPMAIVTWILNLSDRYVLLYFHGEGAVGLYGIGSRLITVINMFISGVTTAYTTFAYSNVENKDAKKQYAMVLNILYVVLIGVCFILSMFAVEVTQLATAAENGYQNAYEPIRDMMFAQVIYAISTITSYGIFFAKKTHLSLISTSVAAVVNLVLNIMFVPKYGIVAAAATTLIGYVIMFGMNYVFAQKYYKCYYGIKKILYNLVLLYVLVILLSNNNFGVRVVVTVGCVILTIVTFWKEIHEAIVALKNK